MTIHSHKEDGRPAQQWYWDTWFSSHDVQSCSLTAQGLWINMLGIMFVSEIRGTLTINGIQMDNKSIARRFRLPTKEINKLITELEEQQVFSRLDDGTIISRRMYRESKRKEELGRIRARAGKKGMQKRWKQTDNKGDNKKITNITTPSLTPTPSPTPSFKEKEETPNGVSLCPKSNPSDEDVRLCQLLINFMAENDPNSYTLKHLTEKRQQEWIVSCQRMRKYDKRTVAEIEAMIRFSQQDSFWLSNIRSMPKLRKQFDQLWLKAKKDRYSGIREWLNE